MRDLFELSINSKTGKINYYGRKNDTGAIKSMI